MADRGAAGLVARRGRSLACGCFKRFGDVLLDVSFEAASRRLPDGRDLLWAVGFVVLVNAVGSAPALVTSPDTAWFRALEKPWFYPPGIAFPVVWTALFTLLGIALWLVWRSDADGRRLAIGLFVVQMLFNVAWSPAFFGVENPFYGLVVIVPLWMLVLATIAAVRRVDRRAAALLVPYLAWVTFAAALNVEIWRLNA